MGRAKNCNRSGKEKKNPCPVVKKKSVTHERGESERRFGGSEGNRRKAGSENIDERLRQQADHYRMLIEESRDAIFTVGFNGRLLDANRAAVSLFEFGSVEELLQANPAHDLFADPDERQRFEYEIARKGYAKDFKLTLKRRTGEHSDVIACGWAIPGNESNAYRAILRDVSEQKRLESRLLRAQKIESIGLLTAGVAHDFNNILTVILGNLELVLATTDRSNPNYEILSKIREEGKKAVAITKRLLAFSRRDALKKKVISPAEQIESFSRMLSRVIGEDIELHIECRDEGSCIYLEEAALDQVIMNLVLNARDAMPYGGKLTIQVQNVSLDRSFTNGYPFVRPGQYVRISVIDTGVGIDRSIQHRVFEPFFTTKPGGTGLGLAVVYALVKQGKGYVILESEPGKGARFDIYFPVHGRPEIPKKEEPSTLPVPHGRETILFAEDDPEIRSLFTDYLQRLGYDVLSAGDGEEALRLFLGHRGRIKLALLDAVMPHLSGPKICERIKEIDPKLPCILLTGYTDEVIDKYLTPDEIPVLRKPLTFEELGRKVRETLDLSRTSVGTIATSRSD